MGEVVVRVVDDEVKADVDCGMLTANGVHCYSRPANEVGLFGTVGSAATGAFQPFEIVVNAEDAPRAKQLLDAAGD